MDGSNAQNGRKVVGGCFFVILFFMDVNTVNSEEG